MELSPGVTAAAVSGLLLVASVVILLACARSKKKKKTEHQRRLPHFTERPNISGPLPANSTSLAQPPSSSSPPWTTSTTATATACVINHATSTSVPASVHEQQTSGENKTAEHDDDSIIYDLMPIPKTFGLVAAGQEVEHSQETHHDDRSVSYGASRLSSVSSVSGQISPEASLQLSSFSQFSYHSSVQSPTSPVSGQFFGSQNSSSLSNRQFCESQKSGQTASALSSDTRKTESQTHNECLWHSQGSGQMSMSQARCTHLPHSHSTGQLLPTNSPATHLPHSASSGHLSSQAYFHNASNGHEDIPLNYDPYYEDDEPIYDFISYDRESVSEDTREMSDGPCYLYTRSDSGVCSDVPRSEISGHTVMIPIDYEDQSDDAAYDPVYVRHDIINVTKDEADGQTQAQEQSSKEIQPLGTYGLIQSRSINQSTVETQISLQNQNQAQSQSQNQTQIPVHGTNQTQTQSKTEHQDQKLNLDQNHVVNSGAYVDCMSSPKRFSGLNDVAELMIQKARSRADKNTGEIVSASSRSEVSEGGAVKTELNVAHCVKGGPSNPSHSSQQAPSGSSHPPHTTKLASNKTFTKHAPHDFSKDASHGDSNGSSTLAVLPSGCSERPSKLEFAFPDVVPQSSPLQSPMSDASGDVFADEAQQKNCDRNVPVQPKIVTKNVAGRDSGKPPVYGVAAKFRRDAVSSEESVELRRSASWFKQAPQPSSEETSTQKPVSLPNRPPVPHTATVSRPLEASAKQNTTPRVHKQPVRSNSVLVRKESFHEELTKVLSRRASVSAGLGSKQPEEACGSEGKQTGPKKEIQKSMSFKASKPPVPPKPLVRRNTSWIQENVG